MERRESLQQRPSFNRLKALGTALGLLLLLSSIIGMSLDMHHVAHASGIGEYPTRPEPWGVAFDGNGHVFIAEPGCLLPICSAPLPQGYIGEYAVSSGSLIKEYQLPSGYTSPAFLALDTSGNVWFTQPNSDAIGILNPTVTVAHPNGIWSQVSTSTGSAPLDLVFDSLGNLWFTEYSSGKVGFINTLVSPILYVAVETALPTANSHPYGITKAPDGTIWLTENATGKIAHFTPSITGTHILGSIAELTALVPHPHLIAADAQNNIWYSGEATGEIGEHPATGTDRAFSVETDLCPAPTGTSTPPSCSNTNVVGLAVASNGTIWFDDANSARIGFLDPTSGSVTAQTLTNTNARPGDGLAIDASNNVIFTEEQGNQLGKVPSGTLGTPTPTPTGTTSVSPTATTPPSPTPTATTTASPTATTAPSPTPTATTAPSPTPTLTPTTVPSPTPIPTATNTPSPTPTATTAPSPTITPTTVPSPTPTITPTVGPSPTATDTPSPTPTITPTTTTVPSPTPTTTNTPSPTPTPPPGGSSATPVNTTWYFAEGRVGKGFKEFLTLGNLDPVNDCAVQIQYFFTVDGTSSLQSKIVTYTVTHSSRHTQAVNSDIGIEPTQTPAADVSAVVTVDQISTPACPGIVAERPMYFNYHGVTSESDVLGATHAQQTYYFGDVQTVNGTSSFSNSYFTILTPAGEGDAHVVVTYFLGGNVVGTQSRTVPAGSRGTIASGAINLPQHTIALLTSDQPVVVERPTYNLHVNMGNAGVISSAASVIGAQGQKNDWLFAEGYTGGKFQENLALANFGTNPLLVQIKLEYTGGHTQTLSQILGASDQVIVDINQAMLHPVGQCDTSPCQISPEVSIDVSANGPFVAERELFFLYKHTVNGQTLTAIGGTDVVGLPGPNAYSAYSFAEGYVNTGYHEWLTLQNPTSQTEVLTLTLVNSYGRKYTTTITISATTRATIDITQVVPQQLVQKGDSYLAYEIAMTASAANTASFVAERPMYSNTTGSNFPTQGGTDIIGYVGN